MAVPNKPSVKKPQVAAKNKRPTSAEIVKDIRKRYGDVIDLKSQPALMIEILNKFGNIAGVDGTGGVSPGTSTVAVGITPPGSTSQLAEIQEVLKAVLKLQKQFAALSKKVLAR
jgi:vacuolar-type H+-ATPase catalytic subunit A/Vma1